MSVVTVDGKLYSFILNYAAVPVVLNMAFTKEALSPLHSDQLNPVILDSDAVTMLNQKHFLHIATRGEAMKPSLKSIYIHQHILWFTSV